MPRSYHNLKKGLIRPDWSKYTLYKLAATEPERQYQGVTFFQQKWSAKTKLRGYHSPHVREKRWQRLFDRRLPAVVPMDYRYLARSDGSELAAGRGSGVVEEQDGEFIEQQGQAGTTMRKRTPYMHMAFFPLEKRLDSVIWRALFASSVKQARSMILHGGVKVNGIKMLHPGYRLNPGDMFSVDPERVMYATGATKRPKWKPDESKKAAEESDGAEESAAAEESTEETTTAKEGTEEAEDVEVSQHPLLVEQQTLDLANAKQTNVPRKTLLALRQAAIDIADKGRHDLPAAKIQNLRAYKRDVLQAIAKIPKTEEADEEAVETARRFQDQLVELTAPIPDRLLGDAVSLLRRRDEVEQEEKETAIGSLVAAAIEQEDKNPYDASKPYLTPWQPRKYMSAFAFIPRYLEVNQNICAGIYLRDPVARPGLAEVPTPYDQTTSQLGFNWYLRRG